MPTSAKTPPKTKNTRDPRQGARRPASIAPEAMAPGPCSPDQPGAATVRFQALVDKMGLSHGPTPPDPTVLAKALLAHMPEVAELVVFALEEEVEPFKSTGVTAAHLDGFIGLLESLCDELGVLATRRVDTARTGKAAGAGGAGERETAPE